MRATLLGAALLLTACGDRDDTSAAGDDTHAETPLQWWMGCGDPVCQSYSGPFAGVSLCADLGVSVGDGCDAEAATCDPVDDCNALLICATEDPTEQPGGCPVSLRSSKTDIAYLGPSDLAAARDALLDVRLARWRYRWDPPATERLGFIIDDQPAPVAIQPDGRHVDVYGYASLAVAAAQAQQAELNDQAARLAAQEAELAALKAELAALRAAVRERPE